LKTAIKYILQTILGFNTYLYLFSIFIIKKLRWDKNEKDFLHFLRLLPEDGIVLDIGANIGVMSYHLAKKNKLRKVYAFEPIPYNYQNIERIKKHFRLDNIEIVKLALGDQNGVIDMVLPVQHSVRFHGLAHVIGGSDKTGTEGEIFTCPVSRLDDFEPLAAINSRITGIKIDVENFEYFVLKGAAGLLKKHKPLIYCELWDNENRKQSMEFLRSLGYSAQILEREKLVDYASEKHSTQNFFFVPDNSIPVLNV
jgi:FkbM family methyltransferase